MAVLVVGNAVVDLGFEVPHLPRPGETLLAQSCRIDVGGKGLNQAIVAARAGAEVRFRAVIGRDADGDLVLERLRDEALIADGVIRRDGPTDRSIIYLNPSGENCIVSTDLMAKSMTGEDVATHLARLGPNHLALLQGNLSHGTTEAILAEARAKGATTVLNAAPIAFAYDDLWRHVAVAVVNEVEARHLGGDADPMRAAERLRAAGVALVIVTLGAAGALVVDHAGPTLVAAPRVEAVDTTGAGDVFCGVLAAALERHFGVVDAVRWAVEAAALSVGRRGTSSAFPTTSELQALRPNC